LRGRPGEHVGIKILAWPPGCFAAPLPGYFGSSDPVSGVRRRRTNADGTLPAIFPQNAILVPFAMTSHDQFRPVRPPHWSSALYAADSQRVKAIGRFDKAIRTAEQTQLALLCSGGLVNENHAIRPVIESLSSRIAATGGCGHGANFALINFAGKTRPSPVRFQVRLQVSAPYHASGWRHGRQSRTEADPTWDSLFIAPRHPEYIQSSVITPHS